MPEPLGRGQSLLDKLYECVLTTILCLIILRFYQQKKIRLGYVHPPHNCFSFKNKFNFFRVAFLGVQYTGTDLTPYLYPEIKQFNVKTLKQMQYN